jgi:hypothetical protein
LTAAGAVLLSLSMVVADCATSVPAPVDLASAGTGIANTPRTSPASAPDPTAAYLAQLDIPSLLDRAATYGSPVTPNGDPNAFVARLQAQYRGVDRVAVLREVFAHLTAGALTETAKERAVLGFVQHLSVHDFASPFIALPIFDPLILFAVFAMDCQKDSRLIADLYASAGYSSRIVDMYGHAVAEVRYEGGWHYADADMFGGGQVVTMADGHIPSVAELSGQPALLDRLPVYLENDVLASYPGATGKHGAATLWTYPSYAYFSAENFARDPGYPAYLARKTFPATASNPDLTFGWNDPAGMLRTPASDIALTSIPSRPSPEPPSIQAVQPGPGSIDLTVGVSTPAMPVRYQVLVATTSRGWDYGAFMGAAAAQAAWANPGGWTPAMYQRLFDLPPSDAATMDAPGPTITIHGLAPGTYYVSVMATDAYGRQVGRGLYPASNELRVRVAG